MNRDAFKAKVAAARNSGDMRGACGAMVFASTMTRSITLVSAVKN